MRPVSPRLAVTALALAACATPAMGPEAHAAANETRVPGRLPIERFIQAPPRSGAGISSLPVLDPTAIGARTNGRIFATAPGRGGYGCSGTALNTPSRSVVLTAGHCIVQNRDWGARFSFVPAYDHGRRPFGTFHARSFRVSEQWRLNENSSYDLGALIVSPNARGRLTDVVGARGYLTGASRFSRLEIFGYPAGVLFGQELRACAGRGQGKDPFSDPGPPAVPTRCDMAGGASGGGWLVDGQYLNGVTSYGYSRGTRLFSPYFGAAAAAFLHKLP